MDNLNTWYRREVYSWRTGAAVGWSLLSQPFIWIVYLACCNVLVLHPLEWMSNWLCAVFSLHFVMMTLLLTVMLATLCILSSSSYTVIPEISPTRLQSVVHMLTLSRLIQCGAYMVAGAFTAWVCSSCIGGRYSNLALKIGTDSGNDVYQLNEYHLFLVVYGIFIGFSYHVSTYIHQQNYIQFPVLQQAKFFQFQSKLLKDLMESMNFSLWQTLYFYPLYWLFGHIPRDIVLYHITLTFSNQPLNSVWGMLDLRLLYQIVLCGMLIKFTWTLSSKLYKIFNAEHFAFPVQSTFKEESNKCVHDAIGCKSNPLVQYLGFFDLYHLSRNSSVRRKEIFSLSQPGGHPHNWKRICSACLSEIDALNQKVQESNWKVFANAPVRQNTSEIPTTNASGEPANLTFRSSTNGSITTARQEKPQSSSIQTFKDVTMLYLKKKPVFSYFLTEYPDSKSRQLFSESQIQVWAVEALSNLATASYTEDKFGVVQRSLPEIITSVLSLQENVDKHFKLATTVNRRGQKDAGTCDAQLGYLLQMSLKSCMYKIVNTFGSHVMSLSLSPDTVRKLKQFMDYKE